MELRDHEAAPALASFAGEVESILDGSPESFWRCRAALERLLASGQVASLINGALAHAHSVPTASLRGGSEQGWVVLNRPRFILQFLTPSREEELPRFLHGSAWHRLIGALGPGPIAADCYRHPSPHPPDQLDRSVRVERTGRRSLAAGELLAAEAWRDVVELVSSGEPAFALELCSRPIHQVRWTYSRETLEPGEAVAADLAANHIQTGMGVLLALGHPDSAATFERIFTEHPNHQVRWQALRALMELDAQRGQQLLARAAEDPHPHIRRAARRALGMKEGTSWP